MRLIGFFLSLVLGYNVGVFSFDNGSSRYYVFKLYSIGADPKTAKPIKGFACKCEKNSGTSATTWQGWPDNGCDNSSPPDQPISLGDAKLGTFRMSSPPPIPAGACCKSKPRINGTIMPGVPQGNC